MRRVVQGFWPAGVWMGIIFTMSTDLGAAPRTGRILGPLLRGLFPSISTEAIEVAHMVLRKSAHVLEYAILAMLVLRALRILRNMPGIRWSWPLASAAIGLCALYAGSDEIHQWFVGSRGASIYDVLIDTCGAALGVLLVYTWRLIVRGNALPEPAEVNAT